MSGLHRMEPVLGALLTLVVLADVFFTVLYARMGTAILSERLGRALWMAFRGASKLARPRRDRVLAYAGPIIVLTVLAVWVVLLMLGVALVIHPHLGTAVTSSSGPTKTDFMTAFFAAGNSITLVGSGNFSPQTPAFKAFLHRQLVRRHDDDLAHADVPDADLHCLASAEHAGLGGPRDVRRYR